MLSVKSLTGLDFNLRLQSSHDLTFLVSVKSLCKSKSKFNVILSMKFYTHIISETDFTLLRFFFKFIVKNLIFLRFFFHPVNSWLDWTIKLISSQVNDLTELKFLTSVKSVTGLSFQIQYKSSLWLDWSLKFNTSQVNDWTWLNDLWLINNSGKMIINLDWKWCYSSEKWTFDFEINY